MSGERRSGVPVRIRLFAALREAAGTSETTARPGPLADLLSELEERYGEPFVTRLRVASVLVDGQQTERNSGVEVPDEAEVALLPPFSGGAGGRGQSGNGGYR